MGPGQSENEIPEAFVPDITVRLNTPTGPRELHRNAYIRIVSGDWEGLS